MIESGFPAGMIAAAVTAETDLFDERTRTSKSSHWKEKISASEDFPSHLARRATVANGMARAKSELSEAKKWTEALALRVVESRVRARASKKEIARLKKSVACQDEEWALVIDEAENHQYMEVTRELEIATQELSNMKLDMASAVEMKKTAEEETRVLEQRMESYLKSMEELEKEAERVNEEHVLVELARIEASKEYRGIEVQRKAEAKRFSRKIEEVKTRKKDLMKEVDHAKELETKLAITTSDLDVLQNEVVLIREFKKNLAANKGSSRSKDKQEIDNMRSLQTSKAQLETAKNVLITLEEERFRFMSSINFVREDMNYISSEVSRMKKLGEKTDRTVQNLNSQLLRAKSKLEAANIAEKKTKAMTNNLSVTLESLQRNEREARKQYEEMVTEIQILKSEIEKDESNTWGTKEKLLDAMQELEARKASEAVALERLKLLSEKTMKQRASLMQKGTAITISRFEYNYLIKCGEGAQELADRKVAAAQAWTGALKASEKEAQLQTEMLHRELQGGIKELEEKGIHRQDEGSTIIKGEEHKRKQDEESHVAKSMSKAAPPRISLKEIGSHTASRRSRTRRRSTAPGKASAEEVRKHLIAGELVSDPQAAKLHLAGTPPRISLKENLATPSRKSNVQRRTSSSGVRVLIGPPSLVSKPRKKVMPNVVKFLRARRAGKQKLDI